MYANLEGDRTGERRRWSYTRKNHQVIKKYEGQGVPENVSIGIAEEEIFCLLVHLDCPLLLIGSFIQDQPNISISPVNALSGINRRNSSYDKP